MASSLFVSLLARTKLGHGLLSGQYSKPPVKSELIEQVMKEEHKVCVPVCHVTMYVFPCAMLTCMCPCVPCYHVCVPICHVNMYVSPCAMLPCMWVDFDQQWEFTVLAKGCCQFSEL